VIAGQAQHGQPQRSEHSPEMSVPRGVVLHEITRHQHRIGRPVALLRVRERGLERRQCCNAA
jgi:hypothetical protein